MLSIKVYLLVTAAFLFGYQTRVWLEAMRQFKNDDKHSQNLQRINRKRPTKADGQAARKAYRNRTVLALVVLLACTCSHAQFMHADVTIGGSTRLRGVAATAITYQAASGFETSIHLLGENKHHISLGATAGLRAFTNSDSHSDGIVFFAGASYQWYSSAAQTELSNDWRPVLGVKFMGNYGSFDLRYSGGTIMGLFSYRLFNHQ